MTQINKPEKHSAVENTQAQNTQAASKRMINLIIVDESGSMAAIYYQALRGMNNTLESIRNAYTTLPDVEQRVSLVTFSSNRYHLALRNADARTVAPLDRSAYRPNGCTPLYDAVGRALTTLEPHVRPDDGVLVTIITDGEENSSTEFTGGEIKRLIDRLTAKGWMFTYIGANQNVEDVSKALGINNFMRYETTAEDSAEIWEDEKQARQDFYGRIQFGLKNDIDFKSVMAQESRENRYYDEIKRRKSKR